MRARPSARVYRTAAELGSEPGPSTDTRYAVVLSPGPALFVWSLYDTTTADDVTVVEPSGGQIGRWIRARDDDRGEDLGDEDATLTIAGKRLRIIPPSTLSADRVLTLSTTGAVAGDQIRVTRNDASAPTVTIANGGEGGGNVALMPASERSWCVARFDGVDWIHVASGVALASS